MGSERKLMTAIGIVTAVSLCDLVELMHHVVGQPFVGTFEHVIDVAGDVLAVQVDTTERVDDIIDDEAFDVRPTADRRDAEASEPVERYPLLRELPDGSRGGARLFSEELEG